MHSAGRLQTDEKPLFVGEDVVLPLLCITIRYISKKIKCDKRERGKVAQHLKNIKVQTKRKGAVTKIIK